MPTPSSSASPLLRIGAAFAAALAAAAVAAPGSALGAAGPGAEADGGAPGTSTCLVCHTDARFSAGFSHRGLEESADGCATCHADGPAHVKARGGKGNVGNPLRGTPAAERELCLSCHEEEEFAAPKHLAPKGKDARCTDCHGLHGKPMPVRAGAPGTPDLKPKVGVAGAAGVPSAPGAPVAAGPAPRRPFAKGVVEGGWRFVGGEEGRYEQDINLQEGPRLLRVDAEAGLDDADPLAPRMDVHLDGLGDPDASLRVRARKSDLWKVDVLGRRDEHPFPGQNGLHGGETLRETLAGSVDLKLDRTFRAAVGGDLLNTSGDVAGTLFDDGTVIPVAGDADRSSRQAFASLTGTGKGWHGSLRQAWLWETGEDGKDRDRSLPGTPDLYAFDDDSSMSGPLTSAVLGAETRDGLLSVELRGSRSDLTRDVDLEEMRRSVVAGNDVLRTAATEGERDLLLWQGAADAALAFSGGWAVEAGAERRSLREDGSTTSVETLDSGGGPATTTSASRANVTHVIQEERVALRRTLEGGFTLRGGLEFTDEDLRETGENARDESVRDRGFFGAAEGKVTPELTLRGEFHSAAASGQFTPTTPRDRDNYRVGASWRDAEGWRAGADWSLSSLKASASGLDGIANQLRVFGGLGKPDGITADASYTVRQQDLEVDTRYWSSAVLTDGEATSKIRAHLLDVVFGVPLAARLRLYGSATWVVDDGSLPLHSFDGTLGLRWEFSKTLAARFEVRKRIYDEKGVDTLDYDADILQVSLELSF